MGSVIPNANAIGVIKLIAWSAYRIAALAPSRGGTRLWSDNLSPLGCVTVAKEQAQRCGQLRTAEHCPNSAPLANERAQRCGSSDDAAAAEGVEDQGFEGGVGIDGDVAHAVAGAEG